MFFSFLSVDLQSGVTVSISICQNNLQYVHYLSLLMFEHGNCFHIHSLLLVMADICRDDITSSLMDQVSSGKSFRTAVENGKWGISCSKSKTSFSVSLSPMEPSFLTKWPYQKLKKKFNYTGATKCDRKTHKTRTVMSGDVISHNMHKYYNPQLSLQVYGPGEWAVEIYTKGC